jgi:site-specific DNA recombinase
MLLGVKMKRIAIYMRVSTAGQEKEETIQNQKMELLERVRADGYEVFPDCIYLDEGWSGAILIRPDLDRLRQDAVDGKFQVLYFYDRGRIARRFVYQEIVLDELKELEIECISLHDANGDDFEAVLTSAVQGLFAEYERIKIAERMRLGKLRKVKEKRLLLGYQPKYGYNYLPRIKGVREGEFVVNEEQAKVVVKIFEWSAQGWSRYAIRETLYTQGIMPAKAKRNMWSTSVIDRLLRDTTYIGVHYYNKSESVPTKNPRTDTKYRKTVKGSRVQRPKEEWLKLEVPKIVEPDLFNQVQEQLKRNKRARSNNKKNHYLVGGVVECPCGFARTGDPANGCLYYRCNDRLNNALGTRKCHLPSVNATVLDNLVWSSIEELLTQPELLFAQAKRWQEGASPLPSQIEAFQDNLKVLDDKEMRYAKMYGEGVMQEHIYKENVAQLNESRTKIVYQVKALEGELANKPTLPLEKLVDGVIKLVEDLDFSNKRQIIQKIVTKVVATKKEVTVWGFVPVLATEKVGLNAKYRHRRITERRQVDAF